jgi:hypothetical protein
MRRGLDELETYIAANQARISNYGERWRNKEAIATGFVESAVNQIVSKRFAKRQQMQFYALQMGQQTYPGLPHLAGTVTATSFPIPHSL